MRVIGGIYRSRRLRAVEGMSVRPTSDRLRETLFNVLGARVAGSRFLDLCAGSGAVGIEAISRGALAAVFVEQSRRACRVVEANLEALGISGATTLICRDAVAALKQLEGSRAPFDVIFFDPPYASDLYTSVLGYLGESALVAADGVLVVEHHAKLPPASDTGRLQRYRQLKQGESALAFYAPV
ncbi:MAG TPA: 16S rRNA (guanine(966)-N(2))-methyltransferase RsmD [Blastocatellia bacterium]|nr:16S rRNA (guanine(966)-N(2))-methyltransferase RsmD [Blastocatellia bacterium]